MIKVEVKGNLGKALKLLKGKVIRSRMMSEIRERQSYSKKSKRRREELKKAKYRDKRRREDEI